MVSTSRPASGSTVDSTYDGVPQQTGWVGWIIFASVIMIIGGALQATYGLVAAINDEWVVWTNEDALLFDLTNWGWTHMILGTLVFISGFGVLSGNMLARTVGVVVASLSLIANFLSLPAYPVWSITLIAVDLLVIWALTVHGGEMRRT